MDKNIHPYFIIFRLNCVLNFDYNSQTDDIEVFVHFLVFINLAETRWHVSCLGPVFIDAHEQDCFQRCIQLLTHHKIRYFAQIQ